MASSHDQSGRLDGATVYAEFGLLLHYSNSASLALIRSAGQLGASDRGLWLTPLALAACIAPYDLGLEDPRDIAFVVDPRPLSILWGPGIAAPSFRNGPVWRGGGLEFFSPQPIPFGAIMDVVEIDPCGDTL
jgi:hypothetical protein